MEKKGKIELSAISREVTGKKVRFLRRQGLTPVNMYGHGFDSVALQIDTPQLMKALGQAGKTGVVGLKVNTEKDPKMVMFRNIQRNPVTSEILHVDLYHITKGQKIKLEIPLRVIGESPAVKLHGGVLYQNLNSLHVECTAEALVSSMEVDISTLAQIDQGILVKDIKAPEGVTVVSDENEIVVKVMAAKVEAEPVVAPTEEAVAPAAEAGKEAAAAE